MQGVRFISKTKHVKSDAEGKPLHVCGRKCVTTGLWMTPVTKTVPNKAPSTPSEFQGTEDRIEKNNSSSTYIRIIIAVTFDLIYFKIA